jgi:hypothetical protein
MGRGQYDQDKYDKLYDMIELVYILNRLSDNSYIDERSKHQLTEMLNDALVVKYNFDKYKFQEPLRRQPEIGCNKDDRCYSHKNESFLDKVIFFLKSLNDS